MNSEIYIKARCSEEEKKDLLKIVVLMTGIAAKCNRDGLISIGEALDAADIQFLKIAIKMIVKGYEFSIIKDVLENIIRAENGDGKCILEKVLITKAIKLIIQGYHGNLVKVTLLTILGENSFCENLNPDFLNREISQMVYKLAYKPADEIISPELLSDRIHEWVEGSPIYVMVLNAVNEILKSNIFLTSLASIFLLYKNKKVFDGSIDMWSNSVLAVIDNNLISKIIEKTKKIDFIEVKTNIAEKISQLINYSYINFDENSKMALDQVITRAQVPDEFKTKEGRCDADRKFKERVNEFMKIFIFVIDKKISGFDKKICKTALIRTMVEGKSAENVVENEFAM
jgi:hypothetical protein